LGAGGRHFWTELLLLCVLTKTVADLQGVFISFSVFDVGAQLCSEREVRIYTLCHRYFYVICYV